jgi:hypothetical protein
MDDFVNLTVSTILASLWLAFALASEPREVQ